MFLKYLFLLLLNNGSIDGTLLRNSFVAVKNELPKEARNLLTEQTPPLFVTETLGGRKVKHYPEIFASSVTKFSGVETSGKTEGTPKGTFLFELVPIAKIAVSNEKTEVRMVVDTGSFDAVFPLPKTYLPTSASLLTNDQLSSFLFQSFSEKNVVQCPMILSTDYTCFLELYMGGGYLAVLLRDEIYLATDFASESDEMSKYELDLSYIIAGGMGENMGVLGVGGFHPAVFENKAAVFQPSSFLRTVSLEHPVIRFSLVEHENNTPVTEEDLEAKGLPKDKNTSKGNLLEEAWTKEHGEYALGPVTNEEETAYFWTEMPTSTKAWASAYVFGFQLGDKTIGVNNFFSDRVPKVFDTGTSLLVLSPDYFAGFVDILTGEAERQNVGANWAQFGKSFMFCFPKHFELSFKVFLQHFYLQIDIKDLVTDYFLNSNKDMACFMVEEYKTPFGLPLDIIGFPVFRNFDTVFDYEKGRIGFKEGKFCSGKCGLFEYKNNQGFEFRLNYLLLADMTVLSSAIIIIIGIKLGIFSRLYSDRKIEIEKEFLAAEAALF